MSEMQSGNGGYGGILLGTLVGAAIGAGLALLYAPRSGEETRELVAQKFRRTKEKAAAALEEGKEVLRHEVAAAKERLTAFTPGTPSQHLRS